MTRFIGAALVTALAAGLAGSARADGSKDATAVIDKAIKALGGAEKLGAIKAVTYKTKGKAYFAGNEGESTGTVTVQGMDHLRQEFEADFGGNKFAGVVVLDGDKGWRKFNEMGGELDKDALADTKRTVYLQVVPMNPLVLKGKGFKCELAGEEKVGGKPAVIVKVTGPDGKDFQLSFDKESGLPVKQVAKVRGFMGDEVTQETTFGGYKDFGGVKKATKMEAKRDGEKFMEAETSDFKVLKDVDPKTFAEPK